MLNKHHSSIRINLKSTRHNLHTVWRTLGKIRVFQRVCKQIFLAAGKRAGGILWLLAAGA